MEKTNGRGGQTKKIATFTNLYTREETHQHMLLRFFVLSISIYYPFILDFLAKKYTYI